MTDIDDRNRDDRSRQQPRRPHPLCREATPGWASGLQSVYGAVADEPIPSDFGEMLARIDARSPPGAWH